MSSDAGFPTFLTCAQLAELIPGERVTEAYVKSRAQARKWPHVLLSREPHFTPENVRAIAAIEAVPARTDGVVAGSHGQRTRGPRTT